MNKGIIILHYSKAQLNYDHYMVDVTGNIIHNFYFCKRPQPKETTCRTRALLQAEFRHGSLMLGGLSRSKEQRGTNLKNRTRI